MLFSKVEKLVWPDGVKFSDRDVSRESLSLFSEFEDDNWLRRPKVEPKCYCDIKALVSTGHEKGCSYKKD